MCIRDSRETQTIVRQMEDIIPIIALILAVVTILSVILSRMSTDRIVEPINQINLIHPKQNKTYSELTPLLDKIEKQNMDIERQIKEIKEAENIDVYKRQYWNVYILSLYGTDKNRNER